MVGSFFALSAVRSLSIEAVNNRVDRAAPKECHRLGLNQKSERKKLKKNKAVYHPFKGTPVASRPPDPQ
jgi:hypothetical protein